MVRQPEAAALQTDLLGDEREQVVAEFNATDVEYQAAGTTLLGPFEAQVQKTPAQAAVVFEGQSLSYEELDQRANQLAWWLRAAGVGPNHAVGVFCERSLELVIALYGVLKAGAAYLPLDADSPPERLAAILADSRVAVVLSQAQLLDRLGDWPGQRLALDAQWEAELAAQSRARPEALAGAEDLAYVIYTSGSTGRPKGVMIEHAGIHNRLAWMQAAYSLDSSDRVLQKTPYTFDVSVWEFFWPLGTGAALVLARPGGHQDAQYLVELIARHQITTLHFVPSMLGVFLEAEGLDQCRTLRRVIASGEALPWELVER
jgi:non-ribosomal peptide synthetase component F